MTRPLSLLLCTTLLTWGVVMLASMVRAKSWTPKGFALAMGNRDDLPRPSDSTARLGRAAANTVENFVLFAALVLTAHAAGANEARVAMGATLFFWARVVYVPVYWIGIPFLRTLVWAAGTVGLGFIVAAML